MNGRLPPSEIQISGAKSSFFIKGPSPNSSTSFYASIVLDSASDEADRQVACHTILIESILRCIRGCDNHAKYVGADRTQI
jgi:hypothetical protein